MNNNVNSSSLLSPSYTELLQFINQRPYTFDRMMLCINTSNKPFPLNGFSSVDEYFYELSFAAGHFSPSPFITVPQMGERYSKKSTYHSPIYRNKVEEISAQIEANKKQQAFLAKNRSWDEFHRDFIETSPSRDFQSYTQKLPVPIDLRTQTRTKLLKRLLNLNKKEEWFNLSPAIQNIFRYLDANKDQIFSKKEMDEEFFNDLTSELGSCMESETTRGLLDTFLNSLDPEYTSKLTTRPQMGLIGDFLDIQAPLDNFIDELKETLPDKQIMEELMRKFTEFTTGVKTGVTNLAWFLPAIGAIVGLTNYAIKSCTTSLILGLVCSAYTLFFHWSTLAQPVIDIFINLFKSIFKEEDEIQMEDLTYPQMSSDNIIDTSIMALSGIFNCVFPGATSKDTFSFLTSYARGRNGILPMIKSVLTVLEEFLNKGLSRYPGWRYFSFIKTNHYELDTWFEEVREVILQLNRNQFLRTSENSILLEYLVRAGEKLFKDLPRTTETSNWSMLISRDLGELKKLAHNFRFGHNGGSRVETTCLLIRGGPGVQKTVTLEAIVDILARSELPPLLRETYEQNRSNYVHFKSPDATFHDGYKPSVIVQAGDDFGQTIDAPAMVGNEYNHLIHAAAPFPYLLNMADLEDKGKTYYEASYLCLTTNRKEFHSVASIYSKDALIRRFHVDVVQTIKQEFCTPETRDESIWTRKPDLNLHPVALDIYEFHVVREHGGQLHTIEILDFKQLIEKVKSERRMREIHFSQNKDTFSAACDYFETVPQNYSYTREEMVFVDILKQEIDRKSDIHRDFMELVSHPDSDTPLCGSLTEAVCNLYDRYGFEAVRDYFQSDHPDKLRILLNLPRYKLVNLPSVEDRTFMEKLKSSLMSGFQHCKFWGLYTLANLPRISVIVGLISLASYFLKPHLIHLVNFIKSFFKTSDANATSNTSLPQFDMLQFEQTKRFLYLVTEAEYSSVKKKYKLVDFKPVFLKGEVPVSMVQEIDPNNVKAVESTEEALRLYEEHGSQFRDFNALKLSVTNTTSLPQFDMLQFGKSERFLYMVTKMEYNHFKHEHNLPEFKPVCLKGDIPVAMLRQIFPNKMKVIGDAEEAKSLYRDHAYQFRDFPIDPQSFGLSDKMRSTTVKPTKTQSFGVSDKLGRIPPKPTVTSAQMGCVEDPTALEVCSRKFNSHCLQMSYQGPNDGGFADGGCVYVIKERVLLMPFHYISTFRYYNKTEKDFIQGTVRFHRVNGTEVFYQLSMGQFLDGVVEHSVYSKQHDLVMVRLPREFMRHSSIVHSFYLEKDFKFLSTNIPTLGFFKAHGINQAYHAVGYLQMAPHKVTGGKIQDYELARSVRVTLNTTGGDCGNLYVAKNKATEGRKFYAMHVAGDAQTGYGTLLTQELLENYLALFGDIGEFDLPDLKITTPQIAHLQFNYVGDLDKAPSHSSRSTIIKSILYGKLGPVETGRSLLKPMINAEGGIVDPWHNALTSYVKPMPLIETGLLNECAEDFRVFLKENSRIKVKHRILSIKEALDGIENEVDFHGLKGSTSPGYPMNLSKDANLKKRYFSAEPDSLEKELVFKEIKNLTEEMLEKMNKGIRVFNPCVDNLKDERRSFAKILSGMTRMFSGTPFIYLIICRMYFGTTLMEVLKNRNNNGCAIGINPYSTEWNDMARDLAEKLIDSEDLGVGAGDYKGFDGSQNVLVMWKVFDIVKENLGIVATPIHQLVWEDVVNSYHIVKGQVYSWDASLPSGHFLTALINCFTNHINFRLCWRIKGLAMSLFSTMVCLKVMGDDNVFSVHPDYRHIFNEMTIAEPMASIGMRYTTELKGEAIVPFRRLQDVEFVKRQFILDPLTNQYIAPLRLSVVIDMINWTRSGGRRDAITASNLSNSHLELSLHTEEIYNEIHPRLIELKEDYLPDYTLPFSIYNKYKTTQLHIRAREERYV
jgi:hypothetical protein